MKKCLLFVLLLLPLTAGAQQKQLSEIAAHLQTNRISLQYACTYTEEVPVQLSGTLLIQETCYRAEGNGMVILCDGRTRWTVDPASKEVYIESAEGLEELIAMRDSLTELQLSAIRYQPLSEDLSPFRFDTETLGPDWVVTDLR